ncbi:YrbL family protein [Bartonella sp. LJL80]
MDVILKLSDRQPLFEGTTRAVFPHPENPDLLIKIPKAAWQEKISHYSRFRQWRKSLNINTNNTKEIAEYIRHFPHTSTREKHLVQITGLIATDIGWGLVVKAERDQHGGYAKPIGAYHSEMPLYKTQIIEFIEWARDTNFIYHDLKFDNILLTWRDGEAELVLIDGIGESGVFQKRKWFSKHNHSRNIKELDEFLDALKPLLGVK